MDRPKEYNIHGDIYKSYEEGEYDILERYDKKYKMRVRLRFPKKKADSQEQPTWWQFRW